jgi:hypothetical protein
MRYVLTFDGKCEEFDSLSELRGFLARNFPEPKRKDREPIDPRWVRQACDGVMVDVRSSCEQWAEAYRVSVEVVFSIVADRFIFLPSGVAERSAGYFVEMANDILVVEDELARQILRAALHPNGELNQRG